MILDKLIKNKVNKWVTEESQNSQSIICNILKHIEAKKTLRQPQKEAVEVFLWLKFVGNNQKLADIVRQGLLNDETINNEYELSNNFSGNYIAQFLYQFASDNGLNNLEKELLKSKDSPIWNTFLNDLLHNFPYSNYLYSLPMGAGKTYLMACFIYLDLYFANIFKDDKRFAHNFIVFAPSASKTAILPSLKTIKDFDPEWLFPKETAERLKQIIHIEILDSLSSKRKDKLQGNNPNLERVNRLNQSKDFGLVFITNAEKVVLEKYTKEDETYTNPNSLYYDEKKTEEIKKINELRERMSLLPNFTVILDEVHHSYKSGDEDKKLRQAVNILNQHNNVNTVIGLSGTPYIKSKITLNGKDIKFNQIQDIVYNYALNQGIGNFLKVPEIKEADLKEDSFVKQALTDFFKNFDVTYYNKTKSKIAFYCPSIAKLNENILPAVQEWYKKYRPKEQAEVFSYYTSDSKKDGKYKLPKNSLAIFHNLDKPYCDKRVILLVAVGTEGWDCKSLTSVALPRQTTAKNFVLQTTCRCLREVENAKIEKALIYLSKDNYATLNNELQENYNLKIEDLKIGQTQSVNATVRKPRLGKIKYKQIQHKYKLVKKISSTPENSLKSFNFDYFKQKYGYDMSITKAEVGKSGLTGEIKESISLSKAPKLDLIDIIYSLSSCLYGKFTEGELLSKYKPQIEKITNILNQSVDWIYHHQHPDILNVIIHSIASNFADSNIYEKEVIQKDIEIELLEWAITKPEIDCIDSNGRIFKLMPKIRQEEFKIYKKHPEDLEEDFFKNNSIDPQDISFNYIPYKMDSEFEQNALQEMLKISELAGLEVYFNGFRNKSLQSFYIETPRGHYTPDFLILKRKGYNKYKSKDSKGEIEKILILETKGKIFYNEEFQAKEKFVKEDFLTYNPNFTYYCFIDDTNKNDFSKHVDKFKEIISNL